VDEAEHTNVSQDEAETPGSSDFEYTFHLGSASNLDAQKTDEKDDAKKPPVKDTQTKAPSQQEETPTKGTSDTTLSAAEDSSATVGTDESTEELKKPRKKFRSDDPIHWYGILVPPSLRNAQKCFTAGIQNEVPKLAETIVEMRALEQKITHLRAKLRICPAESDPQRG